MITTKKNSDYTIETVETMEGLEKIKYEWGRLFNLKKKIPIFFSYEVFKIYYQIILKSSKNVKMKIFVIRNNNYQIVAIFPFTYETKIFYSFLSLKQLTISNSYLIGFYNFLIDPVENPAILFQRFVQFLKKNKKNWDIIKINSFSEDKNLYKLFMSIICKSYKINIFEVNTLIINCEKDFDDYKKNDIYEKDIKKLKRQFRRIEKEGRIRIVEMKNFQEIHKGLPFFYNIEDSGWKGKQGTSLKRSFYGEYYRELAYHFSKENKFRLFFLQLNNEYIAGIYTIIDLDIIYLIKIGYAEKFSKYSPGYLLIYLLIEQLFEDKKINIIDFYGRFLSYEKIFGKKIRKKYDITISNNKILPIIYYVLLEFLKKIKYPFPEGSLKQKIFTILISLISRNVIYKKNYKS